MVVLVLLFRGRRRFGAAAPILLHRGGQLIHVADKGRNFPDVLIAQHLLPRWHRRPAHTVLNDVVILVLRHVRRFFHELRRRRILAQPHRTLRILAVTVAFRAAHHVHVHAVAQIGFGWLDGILHLGSVALGGSI